MVAAGGPVLTIAALTPDPTNRRRHGDRNRQMIADSLRAIGAARSIVIDEAGEVLAGNGVVEAAPEAGISKLQIVEADGQTIVAVRRRGLTPAQKRDLALYDNRTGELAEWDYGQLEADRAAGLPLQPWWTPEEQAVLASHAAAADVFEMAKADDTEPARVGQNVGDYQTFACPLTVEQERVVRGALRKARAVFHVSTAGDALAAALQAWEESLPTT